MKRYWVLGLWCIFWGALSTPAERIISDDEVWPGTTISSGSFSAWVPDSVDKLEFLVFRQQCGWPLKHTETSFCLAAKCAYFYFPNYPDNQDGVRNLMQKAADETGHPEIMWHLPIMSDGECNPPEPDVQLGHFPDQMSVFYTWQGGDESQSDKMVIFHQPEEGHNKKSNMSFSPSDGMYIKQPNWGWPHGYYGAENMGYFLYQEIAKYRKPEGGYKSSETKPKDFSGLFPNEWRGDPSTWNTTGPKIYPRDEYPGNPDQGVWLPNREVAYLWRSRVSRTPNKTMKEIGEANVGATLSNQGLSAYPPLYLSKPTRPYHVTLGAPSPLFEVGSTVILQIGKNQYVNDIDSVYFYEVDQVIAAFKASPFGLYSSSHSLNRTGVTFLHIGAKLKDGSWVYSRPSTVFVSDISGTPTKVLDKKMSHPGSNTRSAAEFSEDGKWKFNHNSKTYDVKGVSEPTVLEFEFE